MSPAKTADPIEMPFWGGDSVGPKESDGAPIPKERDKFGGCSRLGKAW